MTSEARPESLRTPFFSSVAISIGASLIFRFIEGLEKLQPTRTVQQSCTRSMSNSSL